MGKHTAAVSFGNDALQRGCDLQQNWCMLCVLWQSKVLKAFLWLVQVSTCMDKADLKAVDLQQLFLAMTEEVRIIVVKLADRLHNMRTLGSMLPEKQQKIANETLQVGIYLVDGRQHAALTARNPK